MSRRDVFSGAGEEAEKLFEFKGSLITCLCGAGLVLVWSLVTVITFPDKNLMKTEDRILSVTIWDWRSLLELPQ